jgi:hypothetical protein
MPIYRDGDDTSELENRAWQDFNKLYKRSESQYDRNKAGRGPKMSTAIQFLNVNTENNTLYDNAGGTGNIVKPVSGTMVALGRNNRKSRYAKQPKRSGSN